MQQANWIKGCENAVFQKQFSLKEGFIAASLTVTAMGIYEAVLNGQRVGDYIFAPGWTSYGKRHQYQTYDITKQLKQDNCLEISIANGWYLGSITYIQGRKSHIWGGAPCIIAKLEITYPDHTETILTDNSWQYTKGNVQFAEFYDGETYDANMVLQDWQQAELYDAPKDMLIPQEGELIQEQERLKPVSVITTPKGERVIDFGQNMTGYVEFTVDAKKGDKVVISHAEVLDKEGNFYTENLRSAKQILTYICKDGVQTYKPHFSFMGFRYIRLDSYPGEIQPENFTAIVVHSTMKRTGNFTCSNPLLNQLYQNVIWGQKGNYLDIPTDCPQRDERLGWTGDAEVFVKAASYNFDVQKFFRKWLHDLAADQRPDGNVPHVIPDTFPEENVGSFGWADAAVICPWQIYLTYGDKQILEDQFDSMQKWVDYAGGHLDNCFFGDWLGLDHGEGDYKGATNEYLINHAYYAYSTSLLIKAGKVLGKDMSRYEVLYKTIVQDFQEKYPVYHTQTEHVLALYFNLAKDKKATAASLAEAVIQNGNKITTGFLGTPYILHVLSENGYGDIAYSLLLQEEYPSWLYSVKQGATTIWEHWDGIKPDGSFWSPDMNSYNHYAYGAVADWIYETAAGIGVDEERPGFEHILFKPLADKRLEFLSASIETKYGTAACKWEYCDDKVKYHFTVPNTATIFLDGKQYEVTKGEYEYLV